jgi:hypothetical protein
MMMLSGKQGKYFSKAALPNAILSNGVNFLYQTFQNDSN